MKKYIAIPMKEENAKEKVRGVLADLRVKYFDGVDVEKLAKEDGVDVE